MSSVRLWKPHTRIKLRFLRHYLKICADHHKQDNNQKFTFIDLFCGAPKAHFKNGDIENGSPLIAMNLNVKSIFNDIDNSIFDEIISLKNEYPDNIIEIFNSNTNEIIDEILEKVPPYFHSLFYVDPDKSSQLFWSTMEKIINHSHKYADGTLRRPEILLNFPYYSISKICGFIGKDESICRINTQFYGNEDWVNAYLLGKTAEERRERLLNTYLRNFEPYYQHCYSVLVETIDKRPLYFVVFFSNYGKIGDILPSLINNISIWKSQDFIRIYKYKINYPIDYYFQSESKRVLKRIIKKIEKGKRPAQSGLNQFIKK